MKEDRNNGVVIDVKGVKKYFKNVRAVDGVDISIRRGEFIALLGPNGAGKTTLVEMIEGLQNPDTGTITILGKTWNKDKTFLRKHLSLTLQEPQLIEKLKVIEILDLFGSFYGLPHSRSKEVMRIIGLQEKERSLIEHLSGGQRQRLALGIGLINKPLILILDEPTVGLDPKARRDIWETLNALRAKGTTIILTTHYMDEAEYLCNRVFIMHKGKILMHGTVEELLDHEGEGEIVEFGFQSREPWEFVNTMKGVKSSHFDAELKKARLFVENSKDFFYQFIKETAATAKNVEWITARRKTLDDLFISLAGRHLYE